jgi:uncharacterized protein involved in exopolysaccharide biosynthesis
MTDQTNPLRDYFDVLIRRWRIVIGIPLLAMIAAGAASLSMPPTFQVTAIIGLVPSTLSVPPLNQSPPYYLLVDQPSHLPTAYGPSFYVELLKSTDVVKAASPGVPVSISVNGSDRSLIEITARSTDPELAAQTANTYADVGAQYITKTYIPTGQAVSTAQAKLQSAEDALAQFSRENSLGDYDLAKLRAATPRAYESKMELAKLLRTRDVAESVYLDLARDQARTSILAVTANKPTVIQKPVPTTPDSPKPLENILAGGGLGLLVGILAAYSLEHVK